MWTRQDLRLNLIGLRKGQLTIINFYKIDKKGHTLWKTKCTCGETKIVVGSEFKRDRVKKCDLCHLKEKSKKAKIHGDSHSKLYNILCRLKNRCNNKKHSSYKYYGERSITYDKKWDNYINFKKDMWYLFTKTILCDKININDITIERKDVNGNYCQENCTFIPMNKQQENRTTVKMFRAISPKNKIYITKNAAKFARNHNLNPSHIRECLRGEKIHHKKWTFKYV